MIVFGGSTMIPYLLNDEYLDHPKFFKYNFANPAMIGTQINHCWPPKQIFQMYSIESVNFDQIYANYLLEDNAAFVDFFSPIMGYYYNYNSFVLTDMNSPLVVSLIESYIKLIQNRYGLNAAIVESEEDLMYVSDQDIDPNWGYPVFMEDKERYTYLTTDPEKLFKHLEEVDKENARVI